MHAERVFGGCGTAVADAGRSRYIAALHETMKSELDSHKTTGTYEAATLLQGQKPADAKWVFSSMTDKYGMTTKTKARRVAKGCSRVEGEEYFEMFAPTPSSAPLEIPAAVANEQGLKIICSDVAQAFVHANLDTGIYMKLPDGCGDMSGKIACLN